jgi:tetratricopeptide (TPR) repeat protein
LPYARIVAATCYARRTHDEAECDDSHQRFGGLPLLAPIPAGNEAQGVLANSLQMVWLRALHRNNEQERALAWAIQASAANVLTPGAAGVASLIALDEDDPMNAARWSLRALTEGAASDRPMEALNVQASLALGRKDAKMAKEVSAAVLNLQPADGRSWSVIAFANMLEGAFELAEKNFQTALGYMPEHVGTWQGLGWLYIRQSRLDDACRVFEHCLELDRNFADSHGCMAIALALKGEREKAEAFTEVAFRLDRQCASAVYARSLLSGDFGGVAQLMAKIERDGHVPAVVG